MSKLNCGKGTFAYLTSSCLIQSQIWRMLFQSGSKRSWLVAFSRTRFKYKRTKLWVTELLPTSIELQRRSFMFRFQDLVMENTYQVVNQTSKNLKISPSFKPMRNWHKPRKIQPVCSSSTLDFGQDGGLSINVTSDFRVTSLWPK